MTWALMPARTLRRAGSPSGTSKARRHGRDTVPVSSYHHQAVDRVADDLVVTAKSADGVPEGVEHRSADVIGVQWHPEDLHATSPTDAALFGDLVERARKRMVGR